MIQHKFLIRDEPVETHGAFLATLDQVHGAECLVVEAPYEGQPQADAFVTKEKNIMLSIRTADCAPVLFSGHDQEGQEIIGAAHAGWRSALGGICENTVRKMEILGCQKETITAKIGPCIAQESYEVSADFKTKFPPQFFKQGEGDTFFFDLAGYITTLLQEEGIKQIVNDGRDTYALNKKFFSYRRATHGGRTEAGRQISSIVII